MDPELFLTPDHRWTIWGCSTLQEYLDKYFIPGKFHSDVPEKIKFAYLTVERLIAYSYFYYPLTEEIDSKLTRVFEMAVREKGTQLGLTFKRKFPTISDYIIEFKKFPEIDQELVYHMGGMKNLRNFYAHPDNSNYYGPAGFQKKFFYINFINRLFSPKEYYLSMIKKVSEMEDSFKDVYDGVFVYENDNKRFVLNAARPLSTAPLSNLSLWVFIPVLQTFPQSLDNYFETPPIFKKLINVRKTENGLVGLDAITSTEIKVYKSEKEKDFETSRFFKSQIDSSDISVRMFYTAFIDSSISLEKEKFIYSEFWKS